ncbi:MAG: flagellar biosynthetic protein FliO [Bacillus sp. (in: firmicutes)]
MSFSNTFLSAILAMIFCVCPLTPLIASAETGESTVSESYGQRDGVANIEKEPDTEPEARPETSSIGLGFWDFAKMAGAFLFVIFLLYAVLRFVNKKSKGYQQGSIVVNLGGTSLGGSKSIQLVKIGGDIYIIGVGEDVRLLSKVENEADIRDLLNRHNDQTEQMMAPTDIISKFISKKKENKNGEKAFADQLKQQIQQMSDSRKQARKQVQKKVDENRE